ncbi:type IV secretion system protein [Arsenophonus endosymbiont of Apis mellifera]|jgi:type IV secretion system protein VirB6|uniref:type IV secretion system protein n=1 Tax=Arsenophonus endosymbiont of Apis mellifera TaxID=1541805 RepID=UPI0015D9436B|nr:type IV secretion system protein [Arsenophonus endosymbiont of Apis mellifera]
MSIEVAQPIFDAIDNAAKVQMHNVAQVMTGLSGIIGLFWMIYIGVKALYWYFEGLTVVIQDVLMTIFKASCIMMMAFSIHWYMSVIVPTVTDFPVWLGNTLSGNSNDNMNLVDGVVNTYIGGITKLTSAMDFSISTIKSIVALIFYILGGVPFLGVAVGTLITLKVATTLILVVGPIFIALALFPQTKQYFWGWVGVLGGFVLTQALFAMVLALEISYINANIVTENVKLDLLGCLGILLSFSAFTMLATEIPNYAAAIMGGAPSGGVSTVGGIAGKALGTRAATNMAKGLSKKLLPRNRIF